MGKIVPDWQTFICCKGGHLIIRHLKSGLAEDLEIPWPEKLKGITCEKSGFEQKIFVRSLSVENTGFCGSERL